MFNLRIFAIQISDATGLGQTRQKPELDFFLQAETRTRLFMLDPKKPEPDYETRQNPKGFMRIKNIDFGQKLLHF